MTSSGFKFRLQRVHELRRRTEDEARRAYADSLAHSDAGLSALGGAIARRDDARVVVRDRGTASTASGADLVAGQAWLDRLEQMREAAELDADRRAAEAGARRVSLVRAARDRQALDRLEERARERHRLEAQRIEAALLDELAVSGHRRREARG